MLLISEILIIIAYLFNGYLGFALMGVTTIFTLFSKKEKNIYLKLLDLLIRSLPMSFIGVLGTSMHQIFSWYNLFMLIFLCLIIFKGNKFMISKNNAVLLVISFLLLLTTSILSSSFTESIIEVIQILIMLVPIMLLSDNVEKLNISAKKAKKLFKKYFIVCVATAIGMIAQYLIYFRLHRITGFINFAGGGRVSCFCLFKGASVLSIFMGIGFLIVLIDILQNKISFSKIISMLIIFVAMILNTSRSAVAILIIISAIIILRQSSKKLSMKTFLIAILLMLGAFIGVNYIISLRSNLTGFLDANGRYETWINGIHIWLSSVKNIIFGGGLSSSLFQSFAKPHNMIFQTLAQCGIIFTIVCIFLFAKFLIKNRKKDSILLAYFVILSGMLVTDFYANAFTTILFCLISSNNLEQPKIGVDIHEEN